MDTRLGLTFMYLVGLLYLTLQPAPTFGQTKRPSRITSSRSFGTNVKQSASNGVNFDCPEEFGYYPHPTDCSQYYVCVFGGALLESCTGGLMYSHELQTCDWPRNVGCELLDSGSPTSADDLSELNNSRSKHSQNQHVPSRIRFGSAFSSPAPSPTQASIQPKSTTPQQYRQLSQVQAQVQNIPPPPELKVPPNPVITSRGQPKPLHSTQDDIAKLYAEAHETLPPVEEEESDRQQRVYRGQPSTVNQVQRDRDGIIHQANINAIPTHGKIGSFAFGTQYSKKFVDFEQSHNRLYEDDNENELESRRSKRDLYKIPAINITAISQDFQVKGTESKIEGAKDTGIDSNTSSEVLDVNTASEESKSEANTSNTSGEKADSDLGQELLNLMLEYHFGSVQSNKPRDVGDLETTKDSFDSAKELVDFHYDNYDDYDSKNDSEDAAASESKRAPRQLRQLPLERHRWQMQSGHNFRSIDSNPFQQQASYSFGNFNPYLTPPNNNYNQLSSGYQTYRQPQQQNKNQKPKVVYTGYNLSLPPPPLEDDFRPIAGHYYGTTTPKPKLSSYKPSGADLLPFLIQQLKAIKEQRKKSQAENFAYFHLENKPVVTTPIPLPEDLQIQKQSSKVTPIVQYSQYSTMGGFYNNKPDEQSHRQSGIEFKPTSGYSNKIVSQFSISDASVTTESNYFQYNIIANQKMKGVFPTSHRHLFAPTSTSSPITPVGDATPNINIVPAPNLPYKPIVQGQLPLWNSNNLPAGITYASNTTSPEYYQGFAKTITSTVPPNLRTSTEVKKRPNNLKFSIDEFMSSIPASDIASLSPVVMNMVKYFKQMSEARNQLPLQIPTSTAAKKAPELLPRNRTRFTTSLPATVLTPRTVKGYESFLKSIPSQTNKASTAATIVKSTTTAATIVKSTTTVSNNEEYYDEDYGDEENESLGNDTDEDIMPPSQMPAYMPMSETMAPPRQQSILPTSTKNPTKPLPTFHTGYFDATTTRGSLFGSSFQQFHQANGGSTNDQIPSIINFPTDFFQELHKRLPGNHEGLRQPSVATQPTKPSIGTERPTTASSHLRVHSSKYSSTIFTTTTTRPRYTVRPNHNRGQNKWRSTKNSTFNQLSLPLINHSIELMHENRKLASPTAASSALSGSQLNSIHANSHMDRPRTVSSTSPPLAPTSDNIFVEPPRATKVEPISANRNYYNASTFSHAGYEPSVPQHQQHQQKQQQEQLQQTQTIPFQHQPQAQSEHSSYDQYYSVYDDDIDLYRDIEYQQQQQQQQQQHQSQQYQPQERQQHQSTYRPLEILTTPLPQHLSTREPYNSRPLPEKPAYKNQQSFIYNQDYEEDLLAQIEQDNGYEQPTRAPTRNDQITIKMLVSTRDDTVLPTDPTVNDDRDVYNSQMTEPQTFSGIGTNYSYRPSEEASAVYHTDRHSPDQPQHSSFFPTTASPKITSTNLSMSKTVADGSTKKVDTMSKNSSRPTTVPRSSTTSTLKTTTQFVKTTKPTLTTTTKSLRSKAHANKIYKKQAIKTTTLNPPKISEQTSSPTITTTSISPTTPVESSPTTYSNPFLKSQLKSLAQTLVNVVAQTQNQLTHTQTTEQTQTTSTQSQLLAKVKNTRSRQSGSFENIFDESQSVQVQTTALPRSRDLESSTASTFFDYINTAAYGNSQDGSITNESTDERESDKKLTAQRSPSSFVENIANKDLGYKSQLDSSGAYKSQPINELQSRRIQNYILSDVAPQSFKRPQSTELKKEEIFELSSDASSLTTTIRYNATSPQEPKPFQYSLQTGSHGFSLLIQNNSEANLENATDSNYDDRKSSNEISKLQNTPSVIIKNQKKNLKTTKPRPITTTTTSSAQYLESDYVEILPTTYAPPLRIWRNGRPTIQQSSNKLLGNTYSTSGSVSTAFTANRPPNSLVSLSNTTEKSVQSFTARASVFKDSLSTSNPTRFVSPYKSLENILQEKEERASNNATRNTLKARVSQTSTQTFSQTTIKPFKNYFLMTTPKNFSQTQIPAASSNTRNFSISDAILNTFSSISQRTSTSMSKPRTTTTGTITTTSTEATTSATMSTFVETLPIKVSHGARPRGRSRYTVATASDILDSDGPTTYAPKFRPTLMRFENNPTSISYRRKVHRARISAPNNQPTQKSRDKFQQLKEQENAGIYFKDKSMQKELNNFENEVVDDSPRAEALVARSIETKQDNSIELSTPRSTNHIVAITDRPQKYLFSNKYRQLTAEHSLAESLQNAGYISSNPDRHKYRSSNVLEQLQQFLAGSDSDESSSPHFVDEFSVPEIRAAVEEIKSLYSPTTKSSLPSKTTSPFRPSTAPSPTPARVYLEETQTSYIKTTRPSTTTTPPTQTRSPFSTKNELAYSHSTKPVTTTSTTTTTPTAISSISSTSPSTIVPNASIAKSTQLPPARTSRVNNAIKSSIAAAAASPQAPSTFQPQTGRSKKLSGLAAVKCSDSTSNAKCNEIPSRTINNRHRGSSIYTNQDRDVSHQVTNNRGTHPPRTRPTLKPSGTIVSKAQEFVDIYRYPASRPEPLYPQPTPDKTAAKCRKDVCLLPDCYCGGKDIPGDLPVESVPQIVLLTFDDSVNDLNKQLYTDLFEKGRVNPNGCPITATFYVSHEWTDYSQVQNLYADGHEMASHTISHSFGEQFSQKKWTREIAGQREILSAYGGVKLSDVRGMRAPFLSVGGNKMYKMLYDSNFTYDSSMPVYENRPPSWPYTLDYKIFHDCMIPPCPTRSYPGVWQVPMVMWQDLNGGRCSMGDACSNPSDAAGVTKMIMKNFERHYTTNRAPFGLFYHAAWFTQPHHKEGFIKFLDEINAMPDVWIITNWQALQWVRDPTPISRINSFQPFQCDYSDRPKRCNNPKVCNLWHKSGVRYMKTCQPCPDIYPWTGKTGIRSSRIDNEIEDSTA